jgi:hypothetical protein
MTRVERQDLNLRPTDYLSVYAFPVGARNRCPSSTIPNKSRSSLVYSAHLAQVEEAVFPRELNPFLLILNQTLYQVSLCVRFSRQGARQKSLAFVVPCQPGRSLRASPKSSAFRQSPLQVGGEGRIRTYIRNFGGSVISRVYASRVRARRKRHGWQGTTITRKQTLSNNSPKQTAAPRKSRPQDFHSLYLLSQLPHFWWTIQDLNL